MTTKKSWSWSDRGFIAAIAGYLREGKTDEQILKALAKTYEAPLTRSMLGSGLNRENVVMILREIAPDADTLLRQRRARASDGTKALQARLDWKRAAKEHPGQSRGPGVNFAKKAKPVARKPTRKPTEKEAADSKAINAYLAGLGRRDDIRAGK